jgi:outer membrane protein OmpA-like peptidoglycan-associated protein
MADSSLQRTPHGVQTARHDPTAAGLAELRQLLLSPEQAQISELRERLEAVRLGVEDVGRVLPEAIGRRSKPDRQLTAVLQPTVEEALKISVRRDPRPLVEAIFPIIGPAIRKSIAQTLNSMLQALNQALTYSLSFRGLKWRLEALRTGKSFAEVVLLHSLIYRVEQVFLIHRDTGLLLQHVVVGARAPQEPAVVSGMLTAIQDFVRDAFRASTSDTLDTFRVGELTVWVEQGAQASIAAVIYGTPRDELRTLLQDTLVTIHLEYGRHLASFSGDAAAFAASRPHLEACLVMQAAEGAKKTSPLLWMVFAVCLLGLAAWLFVTLREHWRWLQYVQQLRAEPGIVVTYAEKHGGKFIISGLRDPLAADPLQLLATVALPSERVVSRWEPYQAFYPAFVLNRAKQVLRPPETVVLRLEGGTLYASGSASHAWIEDAKKLSRLLPGVAHWQEDSLINTDVRDLEAIKARLAPPATVTLRWQGGILYATGRAPHAWIVEARQRAETLPRVTYFDAEHLLDLDMHTFTVYKERIEKQVLHFARGTAQLSPGQAETLQRLVADLQAFSEAAQRLGKRFRVTILGHADQRGEVEKNLVLSQQRADYVRAFLVEHGFAEALLSAAGVGPRAPLRIENTEEDRVFNRSASFRVILVDDLNE